MDDLADWRAYERHEPAGSVHDRLSRVGCAYHAYFAVPPYDWQSWRVPCGQRSTNKPALPRHFVISLWPDLRTAMAHFRFSVPTICVLSGVDMLVRASFIVFVGWLKLMNVSLSRMNTTLPLHVSTLQYVDSEHILNMYSMSPVFC